MNLYLKPCTTRDSFTGNVSDETKREEIKNETHGLEDTEQTSWKKMTSMKMRKPNTIHNKEPRMSMSAIDIR